MGRTIYLETGPLPCSKISNIEVQENTMANAKKPIKAPSKKVSPVEHDGRKNRNFPKHTLEATLVLPQKIQDEMGGKPMNRLLVADALGMSPSSSNFRELLSSGYKYGLTEGTEKADSISLAQLGEIATQQADPSARIHALRKAAMTPAIFGRIFRDYANKKLPSSEMLPKILKTQYEVPDTLTAECAAHIAANGRFVDLVRDIGGSPHILLESDPMITPATEEFAEEKAGADGETLIAHITQPSVQQSSVITPPTQATSATASTPKPIFVGHGKNKGPLQQLQKLLSTFQIPHKVVVDEANLGRPIPQKVRETI
jgi:hypothetical protein